MKIETFDLRAFGPFTDKVLDFSKREHGLQVIFGLNEAGKSTALRALTAALFGIHRRTADDFVHEYTTLRLAMTLQNANGEQISFVRRKATKDPLRDQDDCDALAGDVLRPFLGGVDADEFERVFGLDHVRLREGGDRLLDAAEGADAAIVGAALGLNHLREVRDQIETAAAAIFAARGKKATINAAITDWKRLQKDLRDRSLSASAWRAAVNAAKVSASERDQAIAAEKELLGRRTELSFVRRNRPRVARLAELRTKLEALVNVPDLDAGFETRRHQAETERREVRVRFEQLQKAEVELREKLASLPGDFALLDHEEEIEQLRELSSQAAKGANDRERLGAKARAESGECARLAGELGLPVPLEAAAVEGLRIALGAQERCEELLKSHTAITTSRRESASRLEKLRRKLAECEKRLAGGQESIDHAGLASAVTSALKLGDPDTDLATRRSDLAVVEREIAEGLERLSGFGGGAVDLARCPVPGPESLEDLRRRLVEFEDEERQARQQVQERSARASDIDLEIERFSAQQAVPTEDDLAGERRRRDARWRLVRRAWLDGADVAAAAHELDPDRPLAESFRRAIERSDDLADRLRRESDRVAQLAEFHRQREQIDRDRDAHDRAAVERQRRRELLEDEWRAAWDGSGFEVRSPAAMKDVLAAREQLLALLEELRQLVRDIDQIEARVSAARSALTVAMAATGAPMAGGDEDGLLAPLLQIASEHRDALAKIAEARRRDQQEHQRLDSERREEKGKQADLDAELTEWDGEFAAATHGLPVRDGDPPGAVTSVLRQVTSLVARSDKVAELHERIEKIDDDKAELARRLDEFRSAHVVDLPEQDPARSIPHLITLVDTKKAERQKHDFLAEQLRAVEGKRQNTQAAVEVANRTLADLAGEAGAASVEVLADLVRRADDKRRRREDLSRVESDLLDEGFAIEATERRVAVLEGVDIEAELEPLEAELNKASDDAESRRNDASRKQVALDAMERESGAGGAAGIAGEAASVAARLRDAVERYVRLVVASRLLGTAVERFRERHEAPMLELASKHLTGLTRGRHTRVETDLDDKGRPYFLIRETGAVAAKTTDALSDGTRDQLQLALVLGSLEHRFASGAEPMPLVLDDVLVHFDDERSMAALEVLAEFSRSTQVLLFTHHERIREQAVSLGTERGVGLCEI